MPFFGTGGVGPSITKPKEKIIKIAKVRLGILKQDENQGCLLIKPKRPWDSEAGPAVKNRTFGSDPEIEALSKLMSHSPSIVMGLEPDCNCPR